MQFLRAAKELLLPYAATGSKDQATAGLELHGPLPAPMPRRAGMHRAQLLVSAANRRALHGALDAAMPALYGLPEARKRSEEHTSELQSLMRISYAVFCLQKKKKNNT